MKHWIAIGFMFSFLAVAGSFAQMFIYGKTDYRRNAGAIVVFGARAYADGSPSTALADRVRTACDLYKQGAAPLLIFSGGPGDGDIHETQSMRSMAIGLGVPDSAIIMDQSGVNTNATVRKTVDIMANHNIKRVLAVSHFYHLPRIKMAYQRRGVIAYTVPAKESYTLTAMPYYMIRESVAQWVYYIRPLAS